MTWRKKEPFFIDSTKASQQQYYKNDTYYTKTAFLNNL